MSEIRVAGLFHRYFYFSEGNPGTALKAWTANIDKVSEKVLTVRYPRLPDTKPLAEIDDEWKVLLIQLILHKRLTLARLSGIFSRDEGRIREIMDTLLQKGLIEEKRENLFIVNTFIEPHLIRVFKSQELI